MRHIVNTARQVFDSMSQEERDDANRKDHEEHERQVAAFRAAYATGVCSLCGLAFDQMRTTQPCTHWLLRRVRFKKTDFPKIYARYDYHNIAAFLRWCANEEALHRRINDLIEERSARKVISYTVKWKNIEWTFDCSETDFKGHGGAHSSFPHYHFQMRIDGRQFINFGDFHVPLSGRDIFNLSLRNEAWFRHSFGAAGAGMQEAVSVDPDVVLEHLVPAHDEGDATYHLSTAIDASDSPLSGEDLQAMMDEAKRTGRSFAFVLQRRLAGKVKVQTVISPAGGIPDIAARTERKSR